MTHFNDVEVFLSSHSDVAPATMRKLVHVALLTDKKDMLMMELAAVTDVWEPLVKTTYNLEGDGPLAVNCYEVMTDVLTCVSRERQLRFKALLRWKMMGIVHYVCTRW